MYRYDFSVGEYGGYYHHIPITSEAFEFWSQLSNEALTKHVIGKKTYSEVEADDYPAKISKDVRLPQWKSKKGERFWGCSWPSSTITITAEDGSQVFCSTLEDREGESENSYVERYPEKEHAVLAYVFYKGGLIAGTFETEQPFDPALLKFDIVDVWGAELIVNVIYDGELLSDSDGEGRQVTYGDVILK